MPFCRPSIWLHYRLTGSDLSRRIAGETLDFILREMSAPEGGFYAAWDADSEGWKASTTSGAGRRWPRVVGPRPRPW